jgi:hypothetical protein
MFGGIRHVTASPYKKLNSYQSLSIIPFADKIGTPTTLLFAEKTKILPSNSGLIANFVARYAFRLAKRQCGCRVAYLS